jgi:TRAP-type C4-dicarboxylate transport system substrate-binding protein
VVASEAQTTLRFTHTQPTSDTHRAAAHMAEQVARATNGQLRISIYPAGGCGYEPAILEGVRSCRPRKERRRCL